MNRGVLAYFGEGVKIAKRTFKPKINYFKFYILSVISLLGKIAIITFPATRLLDIRIARLAEENEDIEIFKSMEKSDTSKSFWTISIQSVFYLLFFLAGIIVLILFGGLLGAFGYVVSGMSSEISLIVAGVFAAPVVLCLVAYILLYPLVLSPAMYLYDCNPNLGVSGMFYNSIDAMRRTGKWTIFMLTFLHLLIQIAFLGLIAGGGYAIYSFISNEILKVILTAVLLILVFVYLRYLPILNLGYRVSKVCLFNDICSTQKFISLEKKDEESLKETLNKKTKRTLRAMTKEELLMSLFSDYVEEEVEIAPTTLPNDVIVEDDVEDEEEVEEDIFEEEEESVSNVKKGQLHKDNLDVTGVEYPDWEEVQTAKKPKSDKEYEEKDLSNITGENFAPEADLDMSDVEFPDWEAPKNVEPVEESIPEEPVEKPKRGRKPKAKVEEDEFEIIDIED